MFITPAWAQSEPSLGDSGMLLQIAPFVLIFVIMYFLLIRPQQKRMKTHKAMILAVRRGDIVVTSGGIIGKVKNVNDETDEAIIEIAKGVEIKVIKSTLADVRARPEPARDPRDAPADTRPTDTRPADTRPADTRPADTRQVDTRPADTKSRDDKRDNDA